MRSIKNVAVFTEDGAFALFFRTHPGGFDSSRVPTPGNLPSKAKKNANARGSAREGGGALGAAGIDWCIISSYTLKTLVLFEWSENPGEKQWTGSSLTQRIVNIVTVLLRTLEQNKGIRSFWYKDYNVLRNCRDKMGSLPAAINRVTIILRCL